MTERTFVEKNIMKKSVIIKVAVSLVVFVLSVIIISAVMNQSSMDITMEMSEAEYPLVYIESNNTKINCMRGYAQEMQANYMRETITPLSQTRALNICLQKFNCKVTGMSYEVRSVDGSRLVENTDIYNYVDNQDTITATIHIKDLIEKETEYCLIILVKTESGDTLRYYTHIIEAEDYYAQEKVDFALDFSEKTFDKEQAKELTKYLESNSEGDNTTFSKVTINSSFSQITWGELKVNKVTEPEIYIRELAGQTGTIELRYMVSVQDGKETDYYNVVESFRVRKGNERMYLLDYERTMNQIFNWENTVFVNNKIVLGITDENVQMVESDGGSIVAFVQENCLFGYNAASNRVAYIFGFYNEDNWDARTLYDAFDIKVLSVDETGNIRFMVYGYMNRGRHEGNVGIQIYYYNSTVNTIEEEVFIPYDKSFHILKQEIGELSYVNNSNQLYLILDATLYCVDLEGKSYHQLISNLPIDSYKVSDNNRMIVWQEGDDLDRCERLNLMNFNTRKQIQIEAGANCYVKPIGFMGEDLIYGVARKGDLVTDPSGSVTFPMYAVKIQDQSGNVLKNYEKNNYYVVGAQITDNQINLNRVMKIEEGTGQESYIRAEDDQILDNDVEEKGSNTIETAVTEEFEKVVQIALKKAINVSALKFQTPKEVIYEGGREIAIASPERTRNRYYVYGLKGMVEIEEKVSDAVRKADQISGVVVNDAGGYVWMKGNRSLKNQIMKIEEASVTEEKNSVAVCLDTILKCEGVTKNTELLLERGDTVLSILEDNLEGAEILDLSGCSLDSVLYYVNRDIPVLAMLQDGNAVLIVGFNELNTVIMDPQTGKIYKKGINDSTKWFEENGNCFMAYIK